MTHYHLTYCSNIHPAETWADTRNALQSYLPQVRTYLRYQSPEAAFGIGLRLSAQAATELLEDTQALHDFKNWLRDTHAFVFTINGFPYGQFHHKSVKDAVHTPDWTTSERVIYTQNLALLLAELLPANEMCGGISTSPLSYQHWHNDYDLSQVYEQCTARLLQVLDTLYHIRQEKGKIIHIDIEPEPDGLLEDTDSTCYYFTEYLYPQAEAHLCNHYGLSAQNAHEVVRQHLQLCYDVCHFAVRYEPAAEALARFAEAGIPIGKLQISAAIEIDLLQEYVASRIRPFAESTYLHQTTIRRASGKRIYISDLPYALELIESNAHTSAEDPYQSCRIHFHVPIYQSLVMGLQATIEDIKQTMSIWNQTHFTQHLEVETYTWEVLPAEARLPLAQSIAEELNWAKDLIG